ncbi:DNA-binding response OmpR family regulator [Variovorax boronicumulans]|uniref:winged helix-turn-helix domain-containing protein n=1 Tax=Variovorax boronicumulans TaxID=436515 RepID=UPI003393BF7D
MVPSGCDLGEIRLKAEVTSGLVSSSRRSGAATRGKSAAVLDEAKDDRERISGIVAPLGYKLVEFDRHEDLLKALLHGLRLDLLLAGFYGVESRLLSGVPMLRGVLGAQVPLLLMVRKEQLGVVSALAKDSIDDFIVMPCESAELATRVMAFNERNPSGVSHGDFRSGAYTFQRLGRIVSFKGKQVKLPPIEFDLALRLFQNPGVVHSRNMLFEAVWTRGRADDSGTRSLDVHIARLRKNLEINRSTGCEIQSVRNIGYRLNLYIGA